MHSCYITVRFRSMRHAVAGFRHLVQSQANARLHVLSTAAAVIAGIVSRLQATEWCWVIVAVALVWITEALNTAIECACDVACPQFHPLVKQAKDVAAAAVLIAACAAVSIGVCIFGPHLLAIVPFRTIL